ncbi:MAG: hypothetical protein K9K79_09920 [Desulfohalobiaceae bacterium]|nr:hypothetical protein [Desulfohalobiaceae bacterium]
MKEKDKERVYSLIRDHEDYIGSARIAMLALNSFMASIKELESDPDTIRDQFAELIETIKYTKPRIVPLIHLIKAFEKEMEPNFEKDVEEIKAEAIAILKRLHDKLQSNVGRVIEGGLKHIQENDLIVVHTASTDVTRMLVMAKDVFQKRFRVLILKQDFIKTKQLIKSLSEANIDLLVVPEYSLSHYLEQADKLFVGAVSVTHDNKVLSPIGSANIVSLCHVNRVPVYLFANSLKFSYHPSSSQRIHKKVVSVSEGDISFILTTHSHDIFDLSQVDYLITEEGTIAKDSIEAYVDKLRSSARF